MSARSDGSPSWFGSMARSSEAITFDIDPLPKASSALYASSETPGATPFMFVLWQYTSNALSSEGPYEVGIRITSGPNAGDTRISLTEDGFSYAPGRVDDVTVLEFDPGSFVLTAFGRSNAGTIRGDRAVADRFLNTFFRI